MQNKALFGGRDQKRHGGLGEREQKVLPVRIELAILGLWGARAAD